MIHNPHGSDSTICALTKVPSLGSPGHDTLL
jgi:hypothetical protein